MYIEFGNNLMVIKYNEITSHHPLLLIILAIFGVILSSLCRCVFVTTTTFFEFSP